MLIPRAGFAQAPVSIKSSISSFLRSSFRYTQKHWNNPTKLAFIAFLTNLYFYTPILTLYLERRGLSYLQINSLWSIIVGTMFFTEIPTGIIADRIGKKNATVFALFLQFVGETAFVFSSSYISFIAISIVAGIGFSFASGSMEALLYDSLKENGKEGTMKKVMGTQGAAAEFGSILAYVGSGILVSALTFTRFIYAITLTAIAVGIAVLISITLKEPPIDDETLVHDESNILDEVKKSINLLKSNKYLRNIVLFSILTVPFLDYLQNLYQPYFVQAGTPSKWLGLSLAIASIIALFTNKFAYKLEEVLGIKLSLIITTLTPAGLFVAMGMFVQSYVAVIFVITIYSVSQIRNPLLTDYRNRHIKSKNRATVLSTINMIGAAYVSIIGLLIGAVADSQLLYSFVFMGLLIFTGFLLTNADAHSFGIGEVKQSE